MINEKTNLAITGGNLVSFAAGLSVEEKEDILDLLAYADFFASQAWNRQEYWTSWIGYYRNRLENRGCQLRSPIVKEPMVVSDTLELDRITYEIAGVEGSEQLARLVENTFQAMRINDFAQDFFTSNVGKGRLGAFQVVPCERNAAGEVLVLLCALHISANSQVTDLGFWTRSKQEMVLYIKGGVYSFSRDRYAPYREGIRAKLTENASRYIQDIGN